MMKTAPLFLAAMLLAGCATPSYVSPVEVTRFAASQAVLAAGTISITPASGTDSATPEYAAFTDALRGELEALGYRVVAQGGTQTALLSFSQSVRQPERRSPVSVGGNGSIGSYGSGVGVGIGIDLTPRAPEAIETRLSLAIRPAAGGSNLWEGRAVMSATPNSDYTAAATIAPRMVTALLQGFPGTSGETISVR